MREDFARSALWQSDNKKERAGIGPARDTRPDSVPWLNHRRRQRWGNERLEIWDTSDVPFLRPLP